ncbi:hypothetical protein GY45DRAFT_843784 [Cubamyces sp. BRFM 1775]|nr:hypothetical protein GY45DRAFT_843784 [Cubamyces sp. BRFM 1775]
MSSVLLRGPIGSSARSMRGLRPSRVSCLPANSLSLCRGPCARRPVLYNRRPNIGSPHSCARARTVASEVYTEAQSFADCKLHIRTRLSASAFSNFWKTPSFR